MIVLIRHASYPSDYSVGVIGRIRGRVSMVCAACAGNDFPRISPNALRCTTVTVVALVGLGDPSLAAFWTSVHLPCVLAGFEEPQPAPGSTVR